MRCAVVELCLTQRANPNLQGSKPKSCATRSATRHCTQCRPRKGGTGIPVAGLPAEPYPSRRSGLDYLGSNSCTFLLRKIIYNNHNKYLIFFFFFLHIYIFTDSSIKMFNCSFGQISRAWGNVEAYQALIQLKKAITS